MPVSWKKNGNSSLCDLAIAEPKGSRIPSKEMKCLSRTAVGPSLKEILNVRETSDLIDKGHCWSVAIKCSIVPVWKWFTQKTFIWVPLLWQWMIGLGCSSKLLVLCWNGNGSNFCQRSNFLMSNQKLDDQVLFQSSWRMFLSSVQFNGHTWTLVYTRTRRVRIVSLMFTPLKVTVKLILTEFIHWRYITFVFALFSVNEP